MMHRTSLAGSMDIRPGNPSPTFPGHQTWGLPPTSPGHQTWGLPLTSPGYQAQEIYAVGTSHRSHYVHCSL